jgi:hypothetical protein
MTTKTTKTATSKAREWRIGAGCVVAAKARAGEVWDRLTDEVQEALVAREVLAVLTIRHEDAQSLAQAADEALRMDAVLRAARAAKAASRREP